MKKKLVTLAGILFVFFTSCKKDGASNDAEKIITVQSFTDVEFFDAFNVLLIEDSIYQLKVICKERHLDKINYEIVDGKLTIQDKRKMKFLSPKNKITLEISSPSFNKLILNGGCDVSSLDSITSNELGVIFKNHGNFCDFILNNNTFYFWNENDAGGEITLSGKTDFLKLWYINFAKIDAGNLISRLAIVENGSDSDCYVHVKEKIEYNILSKGNIYLKGNPDLIINNGSVNDLEKGSLINI